MTFRCPACRSTLAGAPETLRCTGCGALYPLSGGIADFSGGRYYDVFESEQQLTAEHRRGLEAEIEGARWRIERFYAPRIEPGARVLDCGCGNGVSVDVLLERGFDAWGIDLSALRKWQWRERRNRDRLAVASALRLPFEDAAFDVVVSSGVIEHIGVEEEGGALYRVTPRPDRDQQREAFLAELLRVIRPGGRVFIDCPNGAFPIDFWHGTVGGRARWHRRDEGFLPTYRQIERYARNAAAPIDVRARSPHRRFAFRQVGRHWYGKLLAWPAALFLAVAGGVIATSALNPYLVVEMKKPPEGGVSAAS
ncbi:MAG TPA: methyltransferase domain-containing protein [Thermoanaerobaculia bacterium]|nr:methyltransferase domain-containing protein [Thermoanaerobaculia bacterium]